MSIFNRIFNGSSAMESQTESSENVLPSDAESPVSASSENIPSTSETQDSNITSSVSSESGTSSSTTSRPSSVGRIYHIPYASHLPIDGIYVFLNKDFSENGYQDAMVNMDNSYRQVGENMIRYNLKILFKRVNIRYKEDIRELESKIRIVKEQGLLQHALELESKLETLREHIEELQEMEDKLDRDDATMLCPIESYRRGFLRGIVVRTSSHLE